MSFCSFVCSKNLRSYFIDSFSKRLCNLSVLVYIFFFSTYDIFKDIVQSSYFCLYFCCMCIFYSMYSFVFDSEKLCGIVLIKVTSLFLIDCQSYWFVSCANFYTTCLFHSCMDLYNLWLIHFVNRCPSLSGLSIHWITLL